MNKTIVCVNTDVVNNYLVAALQSEALVIHDSPYVSFDSGSGVRANFDYYLDVGFTAGITADFIELLGERYINVRRIPKRSQLLLAMTVDIPTPKFGFIPCIDKKHTDTNSQSALIHNMGFGPGDKILVKGDNCARGMAQAIVAYEDIHEFCDTYLHESAPSLPTESDLFVLGGAASDKADPHNVDVFKQAGAHYTFNELVDVKNEYRLLFNCAGRTLLATRASHMKSGFQARHVGGREVPVASVFPREFIEKLQRLIAATGLPFGSIDIYEDTNGEWGIFEFCPQFGYQKPHNIAETANLILEGLRHLIMQKNRSGSAAHLSVENQATGCTQSENVSTVSWNDIAHGSTMLTRTRRNDLVPDNKRRYRCAG